MQVNGVRQAVPEYSPPTILPPNRGVRSYSQTEMFADFLKGHGGADVAVRLQDLLHLRVLNNPHFPSDIPEVRKKRTLARIQRITTVLCWWMVVVVIVDELRTVTRVSRFFPVCMKFGQRFCREAQLFRLRIDSDFAVDRRD